MQRERIEAMCKVQGYELVEVFVDDGVSGGIEFSTRPAGSRLLTRAYQGDIDVVIALRVDRLFRSLADMLAVTEHLTKHDVGMVLVDMGGQAVDTTSPAGKMLFQMQGAMAEFEKNRIRERIIENKRSRRANGKTYAVARFGYDNVDGAIVENPFEQGIIDDMLRWYREEGMGYAKIATQLRRAGVLTKQGGNWHGSSVRKIILRAKTERADAQAS